MSLTTSICVHHGDREDKRYTNDDSAFEDVYLIAEGKKIRANSSILAYNSNVLSQKIKESRAVYSWDEDSPDQTNDKMTRVILTNQKYKHVKTMVRHLEAKKEKHGPLTGETALDLLPLTEEYRMGHFQRQCGSAMYNCLTDMRMEHRLGCIPTLFILRFLAAADKYNFDKIRTFCIDECAASFSLTRRKEIAEDEHIAEKTKVTIMDKMCDNMSKQYEQNLKQIREDMDRRCREIEKKRDEFMEITESWKADLKQEVDDIVAATNQAHQKLVDDLDKKKIIDKIDKFVKQNSKEILKEMNHLKEQIDTVVEIIKQTKPWEAYLKQEVEDIAASYKEALKKQAKDSEQKNIDKIEMNHLKKRIDKVVETIKMKELAEETETKKLRKTIAIASESNMKNIQQIASTFNDNVRSVQKDCGIDNLKTGISENYELLERFHKLSAEMDVKIQALSDANIKYEEEKLQHARTKIELRRQMKKSHKMNTWIKWAKPVEEDEHKCVCFRHHNLRKVLK